MFTKTITRINLNTKKYRNHAHVFGSYDAKRLTIRHANNVFEIRVLKIDCLTNLASKKKKTQI